eukprot:SAG31_NODE_1679_length_7544_cov_3.239758_1_plen_55_part_10
MVAEDSSNSGSALDGSVMVVISYDRLANGWSPPPGKWGASDTVFSMRVRIEVAT